jgi:hypothetical protein
MEMNNSATERTLKKLSSTILIRPFLFRMVYSKHKTINREKENSAGRINNHNLKLEKSVV